MKRTNIAFIATLSFCLAILLSSCQLSFQQTGYNEYTLIGIKSTKKAQRERQKEQRATIQKKLYRGNYLLDSLAEKRGHYVATYNLLNQLKGTKTDAQSLLKSIERIDKQMENINRQMSDLKKQMDAIEKK